MITGGVEKEQQALFSGAYAFLHKPIEIDPLITVMEAAISSHAAPTAETQNRRTKRLLIVGDDGRTTALRNDVELRLPDVEASIADTGSSAMLMVAAHDYDGVLADACMPGLNGFALVAELRILRPETPVVLVSGSDEPALKRRAREAGAYAFLAQSSDREQVIGTVRQALQHGELARRVRELNRQEFLAAVKGSSFAAGGLGAMLRVRELSETLQDRITELTKPDPLSEDPPAER
jgi:DNA-binding NtrC family response regulator